MGWSWSGSSERSPYHTWPRATSDEFNMSGLGGLLLPPPVRRLQCPACSLPRVAPCVHPRSRTAAAFKSIAVELGVGRPPHPEREGTASGEGKFISPSPEEGRVDNLLFQKSQQEAVVSGSQEGMESHGQINSGPHSSSLSPAGSSGRFGSMIKGNSRTLSDLVPRADAPCDSPSLADSSEEGSTDSEMGHLVAPVSRPLETSCLVPGRDAEVLGDLPQEVVDTITSAGALTTRHAYVEVEPVCWMVLFSQRRPPEKPDESRNVLLAARVGAVSLPPQSLCSCDCCQPRPSGREVGKHGWVIRFLRGAGLIFRPPPPSIPS